MSKKRESRRRCSLWPNGPWSKHNSRWLVGLLPLGARCIVKGRWWDESIPGSIAISSDNPEIRKAQALTAQAEEGRCATISDLNRFSNLHRAKKAIAICPRLKDLLPSWSKKDNRRKALAGQTAIRESAMSGRACRRNQDPRIPEGMRCLHHQRSREDTQDNHKENRFPLAPPWLPG